MPTTPGLGVEIDDDALAALHEQYVRCGIRDRDDTSYMKSIDPELRGDQPTLVANLLRERSLMYAHAACRCTSMIARGDGGVLTHSANEKPPLTGIVCPVIHEP